MIGTSSTSSAICDRFRSQSGISIVPVAEAEAEALEVIRPHGRYGKGTGHPARLNMGDCLTCACARTNGAKLLYKGKDFFHTDLK